MKTNRLSCIALGAAALLLAMTAGCSTAREVKVDALARPSSNGQELQSYTIRTTQLGPAADSLRYREAARHIKTALSAQGMWESPDPEKADLIVEIDYGIAPPRVRYDTVKVPIFARVTRDDPESLQRARNGRDSTERSSLLPPQRRIVGYEEVATPVTIREKHLTVSGRENRPVVEGRVPPEVFRVSASIEDESTDLRGCLPLLASAVVGKIGRTTDETVTAKVQEDDEVVSFIKRGI